jgi:hypothetical protein
MKKKRPEQRGNAHSDMALLALYENCDFALLVKQAY